MILKADDDRVPTGHGILSEVMEFFHHGNVIIKVMEFCFSQAILKYMEILKPVKH